MPIERERVSESSGGGSRERWREKRERRRSRDRSGEATASAERKTIVPNVAAIEAARARVLAASLATKKVVKEEEQPLFTFTDRVKDRSVRLGKGGLQVTAGALVAFGYLGKELTRGVVFTAAHALDWIGQKMNKWADKLIDKKIPVLSWFVNPLVSLIDASAKSLGIDKTLADHLKKDAADRKKLAEKMLKDFLAEESKFEKKVDEAQKKKARQKHWKDVLGEDVAAVLEGEFNDLENASAATAASAPAPAAAPAAAPAETH